MCLLFLFIFYFLFVVFIFNMFNLIRKSIFSLSPEIVVIFFPGEGGTEEIGNMIQGYIKEIEDLR